MCKQFVQQGKEYICGGEIHRIIKLQPCKISGSHIIVEFGENSIDGILHYVLLGCWSFGSAE